MAKLNDYLSVDACPYCGVNHPTIQAIGQPFHTQSHDEKILRWWRIYVCKTCGGVISASTLGNADKNQAYLRDINLILPFMKEIDKSIPQKPLEFLRQAQNTLHAPVASIMVSASAIDAMLKEKGYTEGSLYTRIDKAATDHLITDGMKQWAHQVRLDANDQRHADTTANMPTTKDAQLAFDFAIAFAEYLFVLPARVTRGIQKSQPT